MKEFFKNDTKFAVKRCLAIALIVFGMIFVFINKGVYYSEYKDSVSITPESLANPIMMEFQGSKTFEQEFRGWNGELRRIGMRFENQGNQDATGTALFNILDSNGTVLASSLKQLSELRTTKKSRIAFAEPVQLSSKEHYTLQVVITDANNPQGFGLFTYREKGDLFGNLLVDGQVVEERLATNFYYNYYNMKAVFDMYVLFILALVFVFIPFAKIDRFVEKKWNRKIDSNLIMSRIFFVMTPVLCFMMADRFNGFYVKKIIRHMFTWQFVFNVFIYLTIFLVIYAIVNRTQYASMIMLILVFVGTIANYYVWIFRGCPILATDLQSAKTAINVAENFSYNLDLTGVWGVVYILCFCAMLLSLRGYKGFNVKYRLGVVAICAVFLGMFNVIFFKTDIVKNRGIIAEVWHPQIRYAKNGTALSFVLSWTYTRVEKPSGYSADKVAKLVEAYESDIAAVTTETSEQTPNVIAIMNESLADLNYNGDIELSEDYLPFIHSLEENTIKGKLYVSIQGANTANSEFEFLTGNSMMFLPFRCIPYNLYVNDETPSMAWNMNEQGYSNVGAYHPYLRSGWNRANVYPLLGFHEFYSQGYYDEQGNSSLVRNYISDQSDFDQIIQDYEMTKKQSVAPFYLFNVTMQNHGGYDGKRGKVETDITILDDDLAYDEAEQYINLAKKSDEAFEQLIAYFEKVDEPTIIVMFGDHQPPITNDFYSAQFGKNVNKLPTKQQSNWYSTPYVIWANYDIEEKEVDMSANYLSSYVMRLAGLKLTGYNKYLLDLQEKLPVISSVCYMDKDGNLYANDEESEYSDLIKEYQTIQYNELFDIEHRVNDFFFLRGE